MWHRGGKCMFKTSRQMKACYPHVVCRWTEQGKCVHVCACERMGDWWARWLTSPWRSRSIPLSKGLGFGLSPLVWDLGDSRASFPTPVESHRLGNSKFSCRHSTDLNIKCIIFTLDRQINLLWKVSFKVLSHDYLNLGLRRDYYDQLD